MDNEAGNACNSLAIKTQRGRKEPFRWLHVALLAIGLVGWMIFVVACVGGPAWSPDGSKILFAYYDQENSRNMIAVYDRATRKTRDVFAQLVPRDDRDEDALIVPTWQADGNRALIGINAKVSGDSDTHCSLVSIPITSNVPLQAYTFGKTAACWNAPMLPQFGDSVYLGGANDLTWLNLSTGQIDSKSIPSFEGFIAEHNGKLVYMRSTSRPAPTAENKDATESGIELGQIDLKDITLKPTCSLWPVDVDIDKIEDNFGGSWEPGGTRVALIAKGDDSDGIILLDENKGVVGKLIPDLGVKKFHLGQPVWSHDNQFLYAPAIVPGETEERSTYSVAEIPLTEKAGRLIRIVDFKRDTKKGDETLEVLNSGLQFSLSPDGKTLAASTAPLTDGVAKADRALFLIDVAHPEHHITRILPPKHEKAH